MRTLTYWVANSLDDSQCYNVRKRTRREVIAAVKELGYSNDSDAYNKPHKVSVKYRDALDLLRNCLGEGRGYWEEG